jgi:hypothetical protein
MHIGIGPDWDPGCGPDWDPGWEDNGNVHWNDHYPWPKFNPYWPQGIKFLGDRVGGDDALEGGRDADMIYGQFGNDTYIFAGSGLGYDTLVEASDRCSYTHAWPDDDHDRLDFSNFTGRVHVDLGRARLQIVDGGYTHTDKNLGLILFFPDAFEDVTGEPMTAASAPADADEVLNDLTYAELDPMISAAVTRWADSSMFIEEMLGWLDAVTFLIADLEGDMLALTVDDTVIVDVDGAGHGWFVDDTPYDDTEFVPQNGDEVLTSNAQSDATGDMDLLTVVMHELGHVLGYPDMDPETSSFEIMNETLDEGVRYLPEDTFAGQGQEPADSLISMDLTPEAAAAQDELDELVGAHPWLVKFLVDGASDDTDPNSDIFVVIDDDVAPAAPGSSGRPKKK